MNWLRQWWKKHAVDDFPGPWYCFDCNEGSCGGCENVGTLQKL